MQELTEFERRARILRSYLKPDLRYDHGILPRPFVVELDGPPSGGKTTTIKELDKFFRRQGFRVLRPQEGPEVIRHIPRTTPEYNIRTALYSLAMLMDFSWGHQYDLVLLDRGIFDPFCWMEYWFEKKKLEERDKDTIQRFFLMDFFAKNIDAAFFLVCEPAVAVERETRFELTRQLGQTTNLETLRALIQKYSRVFRRLAKDYPQLVFLDTTHLSEKDMVQTITRFLLDTFEKKIITASP